MVLSTLRLPLSEWFSGSSSSSRSTPTTICIPRSRSRSNPRSRSRCIPHARGAAPRPSGRPLGRLRALGCSGCEPAGHLLHLVGLDHVAHLHVLVPVERHAALVAARDLAHVLLEALETRDPPVVHDHVVAQEARLGAARALA